MSAVCPKCQEQNTDQARFCRRCHTPLSYVCPACKHVQTHGGACDACGVDFLKYSLTQMEQLKTTLAKERRRTTTTAAVLREAVFAVFSGGLSLLRLLRRGSR